MARNVRGGRRNSSGRVASCRPMMRVPLVILGLGAWLLAASPVAADCEPAGPAALALPDAEVAFVGTVISVTGATATFEVSEVWAGDDLPPRIEVHGLSAGGGRGGDGPAIAEDDRQWVSGAAYLVLPSVDGGVLRDHICTATSEWTDELAALRPADARMITSTPVAGVSVPTPMLVVALAVLGIGAVSYLAFRRPQA